MLIGNELCQFGLAGSRGANHDCMRMNLADRLRDRVSVSGDPNLLFEVLIWINSL